MIDVSVRVGSLTLRFGIGKTDDDDDTPEDRGEVGSYRIDGQKTPDYCGFVLPSTRCD